MSFYASFNSYREAWDKARDQTPAIPLNLDIELASLCNLKCPFCFISDTAFKKMERGIMPYELATQIIDEAEQIGIPALKFNWRGEPTVHPFFSVIIRYAQSKECFHELIVNTNGNCSDISIDGLLSCTKVIVSIDSLNPYTYKKSRYMGSLDKAKHTIYKLLDRGHKNVWVRRVLTKLNEHEDFVQDVKNQWGERVKVSQHFCFDRNLLEQTEVNPHFSRTLSRTYCGYPSQRLVISNTGKIYPCCVDYFETMPIGQYPDMNFLQAWHKPDIKHLRLSLKQNEYREKTCINCTSWASYDTLRNKCLDK